MVQEVVQVLRGFAQRKQSARPLARRTHLQAGVVGRCALHLRRALQHVGGEQHDRLARGDGEHRGLAVVVPGVHQVLPQRVVPGDAPAARRRAAQALPVLLVVLAGGVVEGELVPGVQVAERGHDHGAVLRP